MSTPYHSKALSEGTILREWRLEQVLGVGGFGIVYRAKGVYFGELVAIKEYFPGAISDRLDDSTVTPTDSSSEEVYALGLEKFVEEAKVLWNLSKPERHPNIVSVRSLFEINGTAYMVMDFESGVSLSQMLREGRKFDEAALLALVKPIAEGLDRAHRAGVLHRDIKPANMLLDDAGRPVLIDFGSARFDSGQATSTKVTFYTPPYAAIEQYVKTYPQGPWTDIYALGVTLYQCVTGEKPPEVLERLHGGLGEPLSARAWPGFSPAFTRAIDAAMGIRPAERPQSISEWLRLFDAPVVADAEATRVVVSTAPPGAPPPAPPAPRIAEQPAFEVAADPAQPARRGGGWVPVAATAAVVVLLCGAAAALWLRDGGHTGATQLKSATAVMAASPIQSKISAQVATPAAPVVDVQPIVTAAGGLVADAKKAARTRAELAALEHSQAKLAALAAQIGGLGPASDAPASASVLALQLSALAVDMARAEADALRRVADGQVKDLQQTPAEGAAAGPQARSMAAVRRAKGTLDAAIVAVSRASGPLAAIDAARKSLLDYTAFAAAFSVADRFNLIARRQHAIDNLDVAAKRSAGQVAVLAAGPKPWLFAAQSRKDAYKLLQDNFARSRTDTAQLDQIAAADRSTSDLTRLNAAFAKASRLKADLDGLYASSYAAAHPAGGH